MTAETARTYIPITGNKRKKSISLLDKFTIFIPFDLLLFTRKHWICLLCLFEKSCFCLCLAYKCLQSITNIQLRLLCMYTASLENVVKNTNWCKYATCWRELNYVVLDVLIVNKLIQIVQSSKNALHSFLNTNIQKLSLQNSCKNRKPMLAMGIISIMQSVLINGQLCEVCSDNGQSIIVRESFIDTMGVFKAVGKLMGKYS